MITRDRIAVLLRENWSRLGNGDPCPRGFTFVMVTKGTEPIGKVVLLVFPAGERTPRFALKLGRSPRQNQALEAEHENLVAVGHYASGGRVITPTPLLKGEDEGRLYLVLSVVHGVSVWEAASRSRSITFVAPIVDWLIHLGRASARTPQASGADDLAALVERAGGHAATREERRVLQYTAGRLRTLEVLPRVFEHRDMGTWNLMVSRNGTIGILDWESSCADGFAAWDLFYFLAHYGFMVHGATSRDERVRSFGETFFHLHGFGATARAAVRRYAEALGLAEERLGPLFLACWLHHALFEVSRLQIKLSDSLFWQLLALTLERECRREFLETES